VSRIPEIQTRPAREAAVRLLDAAALPVEDLTDEHMAHFFFAGAPASPTGLVGVELCGDGALLRSLVVDPKLRGTGLGRLLVERAESHARAHGAVSMFLLTTTAESFFRHLGYVSAGRASAPLEIRSTREFASLCPASSAFLTKNL
jgi:amino-acid N-acetyltransferase